MFIIAKRNKLQNFFFLFYQGNKIFRLNANYLFIFKRKRVEFKIFEAKIKISQFHYFIQWNFN